MITQGFHKEERLCSRKSIDSLFRSGLSFSVGPVRIIFHADTGRNKYPVRILFSIPRKSFPMASSRNLIRRRFRESFRRHKQEFYQFCQERNLDFDIALLYRDKEIISFPKAEQTMKLIFEKLMERHEKTA